MTHVAHKIPTMWYEVGIQLAIKISTLDAFEEQTNKQNRLYVRVFEQWRKEEQVPYSWNSNHGKLLEKEVHLSWEWL